MDCRTARLLLDYARPAAHQTHAGRFVGQVLHGGAAQVVHRKADAVLGSFTNPVVTMAVVVLFAIAGAATAWSAWSSSPPSTARSGAGCG